MTVYVLQRRLDYEGAELVAVYQDEGKAIVEQKRLGTRDTSEYYYHTVTPMEIEE